MEAVEKNSSRKVAQGVHVKPVGAQLHSERCPRGSCGLWGANPLEKGAMAGIIPELTTCDENTVGGEGAQR